MKSSGRRNAVGKAYVKYFAALLLFGSNGIVASGISLSSYEIVFLRTLIGAALLVGLLLASRQKITAFQHRRDLICLAASGIALGASWIFLFEAYREVGVGVASLAYYCGPIIVTVLSPWLFREKMTLAKAAGFSVVLCGVFLVDAQALGAGASAWGLFCGGMSAVMYALMVIFSKKVEHVQGLENSALQLLFGFFAVAAFMGFKQGFAIQVAPGDWAPILVLGLVNTGFGCYLYFSALKSLPAQSVSICGYLEPLSAVVLSSLLLGEAMAPAQLLGVAFILGGAAFGELGGKLRLPRPAVRSRQRVNL